jgi:hypothetical protein
MSTTATTEKPLESHGNGESPASKTMSGDLVIQHIEARAKFKKRAESALNKKVLDGLIQIGRCSNRAIYAYEDEQVQIMFTKIKNAVADAERKYAESGGEGRPWVEL